MKNITLAITLTLATIVAINAQDTLIIDRFIVGTYPLDGTKLTYRYDLDVFSPVRKYTEYYKDYTIGETCFIKEGYLIPVNYWNKEYLCEVINPKKVVQPTECENRSIITISEADKYELMSVKERRKIINNALKSHNKW